MPASTTGTTSPSAAVTIGRASPIATTARPCARSGSARSERAALVTCRRRWRPPCRSSRSTRGRVDVGGLRVVDEAHAAERRHRLHHVLETAEAVEGARQRRAATRRQMADRRRRHDVAQACGGPAARSRQRHQRGRASDVRCHMKPRRHVGVGDVLDAVGHRCARPPRVAIASPPCCPHSRPPSRRPSGWRRCALRRRVRRFVRMTIEVIGRKVQQRRNPRTERVGRLELKAARLDHVHRVGGRGSSTCALSGTPMLPPDQHAPARGLEHPADQRRRRRLPLRAGDRDDRPRSQRDASSSSPITGTPRLARARRSGRSAARPGSARRGRHDSNVDATWPPSSSATPARAARGLGRSRASCR